MKNIFILLALLAGIAQLSAQELNGVWLSADAFSKKLAPKNNTGDSSSLIDFDKKVLGNVATIDYEPFSLNRKKTKIKIPGIKGKLKVQSLKEKLLVLKGPKRTTYTFKKLNLTHKIDSSPKELSDFLINQQCDLIQNIQGQFTAERFFKDTPSKKRHKKNQYINFTERDNGYWYFKKIKGNAFFVFTTGQNEPENIFQILSLKVNGFKLNQLQDDGRIKNLTTLKTCL